MLTLRRRIDEHVLPAQQVVACAPWEIARADLDRNAVQDAFRLIRLRVRAPRTHRDRAQP
jgi:hypothetical protein